MAIRHGRGGGGLHGSNGFGFHNPEL
jgi:hypothetical protein